MWPEHWTEAQKTYAGGLRWANRWELQRDRVAAGEMRAGNYGEEHERWRQVCEVLDYLIEQK